MHWRLTLDPPYSFAIEPGYTLAKHSADFRPKTDSTNIFRDENTGIVMLYPSIFGREYFNDIRPLTDFRSTPNFWQQSKRSSDGSNLMTSVKPAAQNYELIELLVQVAIILLEDAVDKQDTLKWALESKFNIAQDESFAIHYRGIGDEMKRKRNWFSIQWDKWQFHFSQTGICSVYEYADRHDLTTAPKLLTKKLIGSPAELLNQDGYFIFIPVPGVGMLLLHRYLSPIALVKSTNASWNTSRAILIPLPSYIDNDKISHIWEESPIRIAVNPFDQHLFGFQHVKFPATGYFYDDALEPPYKPTSLPTVTATPVPSLKQTMTASFRKPDDSADWAVGDKAGMVKVILTTNDTKYTPFLFGYSISWPVKTNSRDTTPLVLSTERGAGLIDSLQKLEWSDDEYARFEGKVVALIETTAGKKIAERGDATFTLEYSLDGTTWSFLAGGFAKEWNLDVVFDSRGYYYIATFELRDMWERFKEWALVFAAAFDALDVGTAINLVLKAAGFAQITPPAEMTMKKLPPIRGGNAWRFQAREGDGGDALIRTLLLFMRSQNIEWRMRYDWQGATWVAETKPRDVTNFWQAVPAAGDTRQGSLPSPSEANRIIRYSGLTIRPHPPEMNALQVEGLTDQNPTPESYRVLTDPIFNQDSLTNKDSPDYLGRMINQVAVFSPITNIDQLNQFSRMIFDRSAHRTFDSKLQVKDLYTSFQPATLVKVLGYGGVQITADLWVKSRSVVVSANPKGAPGNEEITYTLDSVWEGELK